MQTLPDARLARPATRYQTSYLAAIAEFKQVDQRYLDFKPDWLAAHFDHFVDDLLRRERYPKPGRVPEAIFWLVREDEFIGRISVRHELNDGLSQIGGHIGYEIRPGQRRQGYGTLICKLGLDYARQIGLRRALITCDDTNVGSRRIIEANGGQLARVVTLPYHDVPIRQYWVELHQEVAP
jgi:predicted acetyltransferase